MKAPAFLLLALTLSTSAQVITFTNRTATFTNLQGTVYSNVTLVRADLDGVVWASGASGGRVCYTNLSPEYLDTLGVPAERIDIARARAEHKAISDAQYRAAAIAEGALAERNRKAMRAGEKLFKYGDQMAADAAQIEALRNAIKAANAEIRQAAAIAHDANMANSGNYLAPFYYVKDGARLTVEQAEDQLRLMEAEFRRKYSGTNSPEAVAKAVQKETEAILGTNTPARSRRTQD